MMETFLAELREHFDVKEGEGQPVDWLLGMAVSQDIDRGTIRISMEMMIRKLAEGLLTEEELARSKSVRTPMLKTPLLKETECTVSKDEFDYLSVVGSLLHIAIVSGVIFRMLSVFFPDMLPLRDQLMLKRPSVL